MELRKKCSKYEVFRSQSKNGTYRKIATTAKTSYTDTKKTPGATYFYKVRARRTLNGAPAYSRYSEKKSVKLKLSAPVLSKVKYVSGKKVSVKWKKVTGAKGYEIFRSSSKKKGFKKLKSCTKTGYTDKLTKKKTYYYKVRAYTIIGNKKVYSSFSAVKKN